MEARASRNLAYGALAVLAGVALVVGWRTFWFLTDDAHIAFRYVANSLLGHGYTWNPPPFQPVEGYTSFLWIVLLDAVWRLTGVTPPVAANPLSLAFSALTLGAVMLLVARVRFGPDMSHRRPVILALVLLGVLSNRTFLAWTSSGLETAMFHFLFTAWIVGTTVFRPGAPRWCAAVTTTAVLSALTRPDGLLLVGATLLMLVPFLVEPHGRGRRALACGTPLALLILHQSWRVARYDAWLPNTYRAKVGEPWIESGARYLGSFVLEYGLWLWLLVVVLLALRRGAGLARPTWPQSVAVGAVVLHLTYYTVAVGGDHFEYRVYAHLIPLAFATYPWLLDRLGLRPRTALALFALFVACSWPLPWTHWALTRTLSARGETFNMQVPVSPAFPAPLRFYTKPFDRMQSWLQDHGVCNRHQEHKVFYEYQRQRYPSREVGSRIPSDDFPVLATGTVGVAGWVLPHVAVIDVLGLTDRVAARSPGNRSDRRVMAHERGAPREYVVGFLPNVSIRDGETLVRARPRPLTEREIERVESVWWERVTAD